MIPKLFLSLTIVFLISLGLVLACSSGGGDDDDGDDDDDDNDDATSGDDDDVHFDGFGRSC